MRSLMGRSDAMDPVLRMAPPCEHHIGHIVTHCHTLATLATHWPHCHTVLHIGHIVTHCHTLATLSHIVTHSHTLSHAVNGNTGAQGHTPMRHTNLRPPMRHHAPLCATTTPYAEQCTAGQKGGVAAQYIFCNLSAVINLLKLKYSSA